MTTTMSRREALSCAAVAGSLLALGKFGTAVADEKASATAEPNGMKKCIDECESCHRMCLETVRYCLEKGGQHVAPEHLGLLIDCAEMCQTNANFMIRSSDVHHITCRACADICTKCAESCEAMASDAQMKQCAERCRACAKSCKQMAA